MATALRPTSNRHTPRWPAVSDDPMVAARELLDRPHRPRFNERAGYDCPCDHCVALRSKPFTCEVCGYEGHLQVQACECPRIRRDNLRGYREDIAELRAGRLDWKRLAATPEAAMEYLEGRLAMSLNIPKVGPCRIKRGDVNGNCGHGYYSCPVCTTVGQAGGEEEEYAADIGWELVRELRAILTGRDRQ